MNKRDRQGVRTPANLEQKYAFGKTMSELELTARNQGNQLTRQNQTMNEFMSNSTEKFNSVEKDIASVDKDVTALERNVNRLTIRMTASEANYGSLKKSVSGLSDHASASDKTSADLGLRVKNLEDAVKGLTEKLVAIDKTLASLEERVTALEST